MVSRSRRWSRPARSSRQLISRSSVRRRAAARRRRNARDQVFNLAVFKEEAQCLVETVYYPGCLALPRKAARAKDILEWRRPDGVRKVLRRTWSASEDDFILTNSPAVSARHLDRSIASVKARLWRLRGEVTD